MKKTMGLNVVVDDRMPDGCIGIGDKAGLRGVVDNEGNVIDLKEHKDNKRREVLIEKLRRSGFID